MIIIIIKKDLTLKKVLFYLYILVSLFATAYCNCKIGIGNSTLILGQLVFVIGIVYGKYNSIGYLISFGALSLCTFEIEILPTSIKILMISISLICFTFIEEITGYLNMKKMDKIGAIEVDAVCIRYNDFDTLYYWLLSDKKEIEYNRLPYHTPVYEFYINEKKYTASPIFGSHLSKEYLPEVGSRENIYVNPNNYKHIYIPYPLQNTNQKVMVIIPGIIGIILSVIFMFVEIIEFIK